MKNILKTLGKMESYLNGALDGLELDSTSDVVEKHIVKEIANDLKVLVNEAMYEIKNNSTNPLSMPDICKKCNEPLHFALGGLFCPNPKC